MSDATATANQLAQERTDLAAMRTLMAADRTLMSWVRTALSLLSFGFTIYKILTAIADAGRTLPNEHTPRNVGMFLVAMGTLSIAMGAIEYLGTRKVLQSMTHVPLVRPSFVMAAIILLLGVLLFVAIVGGIL